jgi:uncharacterized protein YcnI
MQQHLLTFIDESGQIVDEASQLHPGLRQHKEENGEEETYKERVHQREGKPVRDTVTQQRIDQTLQQVCGDNGGEQWRQNRAHGDEDQQRDAKQNDENDGLFVMKIAIE